MKLFSWRRILLIMALAMVFYFCMIVLSDLDDVIEAARQFNWLYILPVIGLVVGNYLLRSERWHQYLRSIGLELPRKKSYWLFVSGLSMSITPLKAGEAVKSVLLKMENDSPLERGVAVVFSERMSDIIGMILLIAIGSIALSYGLLSFVIIVVIVSVILLIIQMERLRVRLTDWLRTMKRLARLGGVIDNACRDAKCMLSGRMLLLGTVLSVIAWAAECIAFFLIVAGSSAQISLLECTFIYAFSSVVGAVSMLPGGMGTTEATMVGLLAMLSVSVSAASFAVILTRVSTLWFAVAIGMLFLAIYARRAPPSENNIFRKRT